jgi:RHS repeat-associated protein
LGELESRALPYQSYKLSLTPGLIEQIYGENGERATEAMLLEGGYVHSEGDCNCWIPSGQAFYSPSGDSPEEELEFARAHFFLPHRFQDPFGNTARVEYDDYYLLGIRAIDPLDNVIAAENDYRVLQPRMVTDPNDNRAQAAFDALGLVVGTAVMGKPGEDEGDLLEGFEADLDEAAILAHIEDPLTDPHEILGAASTRLVYDLFAYIRTKDDHQPQPAVVYTLARETHHFDLEPGQMTAVQHSFSYSDGFGREVQKKIQAEPGPLEERGPEVSPRWVGSGWTIFNNKGSPVQKYEPFFSADHKFEFARAVGVSSTLFYDPLGRAVATLHPNHTYEKVIFDPWQQESWDVNDTVLVKDTMTPHDPGEDPDVGGYFQRLPVEAYLPTWYDLRTDPEKAILKWPDTDPVTGEAKPENAKIRRAEREAAEKVAGQGGHLWTPSRTYLDTLGRTFLTVADNGSYGKYRTSVELDIEGNQREVIDARSRVVMVYDYDMLGGRIRQQSMEAGARWALNDVAGNPIYSWDSRGHRLRHVYDALRRKTHLYLQEGDEPEGLVERAVYGEGHTDSSTAEPGMAALKRLNLRGRAYMQLDGAGVVMNSARNPETGQEEAYDFKGNPLCGTRSFARDYKSRVDWSSVEPLLGTALLDPQEIKAALEPLLEAESFTSRTTYDALNRPITITKPDGSVIRPHYNEANLLESLEVNLQGAAEITPFVKDIDYNAKGQRVLIEYGNGVKTDYEYDEDTFRLVNLLTLRGEDRLQDLNYTYDPTGNIASIRDDSIQTIFYNGEVVRPDCEYTYDPLYRLIAAKGREHIGQAPHPPWPTWHDRGRTNLVHPNDGQAMRNYFEFYEYDEVGNILKIDHDARDGGSWVRDYGYEEPSLTEPENFSNRLSWTEVGSALERYTYNQHGSMTSMAHLPVMDWDFKEQLQMADKGGGCMAYYVYDAGGQRARKVIKQNGTFRKERLYLGGFEVYREYNGANGDVKLERETLHVMDGEQRIALVERRTRGNDGSVLLLKRFQIGNHIGSTTLELNSFAEIISYEEYYSYGGTSYQAINHETETSKQYRFTAMERDEETGLNYHELRYYAVWLGRWTSADPAGLVDGLNLYGYVKNQPTKKNDPRGLGDPLDLPPELAYINMAWQPIAEAGRRAIDIIESVYIGVPAGLLVILRLPNDQEGPTPIQYPNQTAGQIGEMAGEALLIPAFRGVAGLRPPTSPRPPTITEAPRPPTSSQPSAVPEAPQPPTSSQPSAVPEAPQPPTSSQPSAVPEAPQPPTSSQPTAVLEAPQPPSSPVISLSPQPSPTSMIREVSEETLIGHSRRQMRRAAANIIRNDPNHPLRFLLDEQGNIRGGMRGMTDAELANRPDLVQMGHITSSSSGEPERIMLQGAWENQFANRTIESRRCFISRGENEVVDIGGIAVDADTARFWEEIGWENLTAMFQVFW